MLIGSRSLAIIPSLLAMSVATAQLSWAEASSKLPSHIANWVKSATKVGAADDSETVKLSAFLGLRDADSLKQLIEAQTTRDSPKYGRYLTASEFHARFAPSAAEAAQVETTLRNLGFKIGAKSPSNVFVEFTGTVKSVKSVFHVSQNMYSFDGKVMRANAEEPTLPSALRGLVSAISGLADTGQLKHPFHRSINDESEAAAIAAARVKTSVTPFVGVPPAANLPSPYCSNYYGDTVATLSTQPAPYAANVPWLVCGYTPQQMRAAYGANKSTLNGKGVTVAIVDAFDSPTLLYDANRYSKNHELPKLVPGTNFQDIYPGNIAKVSANDVCGPQGWFSEISLDVDAVHTMAPGANILYAGGLSCTDVDLNAALYTVVDGTETEGGPLADIVSNSYGQTGEPESEAEQDVDTAIFEQAAAEGISVLFSSGDDGDVAQLIGYSSASESASNPYVTAVGGTSLGLKDASGTKSEWGWGTFRAYLTGVNVKSASVVSNTGLAGFAFYAGAGGGPSHDWYQPDYQAGVVPAALTKAYYDLSGKKYSLPGVRVTPDIAMDADPYTGFIIGETYAITGNPTSDSGCTSYSSTKEYCENPIGGTSLASPLFAGTLAVVTQLRHANGLANIGFANPRLYELTVGAPGSTTTPLADVLPPAVPTSVLRGYVNDLTRVRLVTINSVPGPYLPLCKKAVCEGQDSLTLETKPGYDDVTGVGTPYIPSLLVSLGQGQ